MMKQFELFEEEFPPTPEQKELLRLMLASNFIYENTKKDPNAWVWVNGEFFYKDRPADRERLQLKMDI